MSSIRFATPLTTQSPDNDSDDLSSSDSEDYPEEDNNFDDWVSDEALNRPCRSLFDEKDFPNVDDALRYDQSTHGFNLTETCTRLNLDLHQRIRLINYIRKDKPTSSQLSSLTGKEPFFTSDEYLLPVIEDDPLLQLDLDDWSDDEGPSSLAHPQPEPTDLATAVRRIRYLEEKLSQSQKDLADYRNIVSKKVDVASFVEIISEPGPSTTKIADARDDDSHYFQSYGEIDIHAVMINDKVRTSSYASFILKNPLLFENAIVLDVGCGTGILSLFAAKSGAKHVYAVDASGIADKAKKIVQANGLSDVITVIRGKVEEISLPDGVAHVDIIISEWMGYALLYESMLDSVLHARDRFLSPNGGGIMAPSQCRMMLVLCEGNQVYKERVGSWSDVYGFDLSEMAKEVYDNAIIDVVPPESVVSAPCTIKDLHLRTITPRQLDFKSSFSLTCTSPMRTKIHAFVLYFDTFFAVDDEPLDPSVPVTIIKEGDPLLAEVWPVGGKSLPKRRASMGSGRKVKENGKKKITSFSTGPLSHYTHWKQTVFLLRDPIAAEEGTVVSGTFSCKKNGGNSRELDVEIHYSVKHLEEPTVGETVVQIYTVR
ncbi:S-adenosyl-L-methionine-dependent methyltransferase [Pisolithus croceorrhizus]|nr:S-adenosyl-L-methionine-dependent methyltransferase [Pisolithus croceorrhizus]KAI6123633.1 S-adenosyl-L-methionine-dependent methyltransferase [Pisolithus croceorrhizus]KAI6156064.1 S-adenosyl-L-methionine-dependent methyltransferase [Pisolithus thermaeus]